MTDYKEEGKIVVPEMANALKQLEPVTLLKTVHQLLKEVNDLYQKQQEEIKSNLQQYMQITQDKEKKTDITRKEIENVENEEKLVKEKTEEESEHNNKVLQQYEAYVKAISEKIDEENELKAYRKQVTENTTDTLPQTRFKVNLFQKLLGVQWDYNSDPNEVKGYVSTRHDVRPFCLNTQQNSEFFIANHLWDLVEAAHRE
ncbi:kinetochore protein spc24-like [Ptychodera flava]|uniref:kinetochore protein spc24-like n=1 Tax=Ptychodera flava TaxID=63121 RepID=UPI003969ECDA